MKSEMNKGQVSKMSRLGLLSFVTWMVVSLSAGTALAADFKLRYLVDGKPGDEVKHITTLEQEKEAVALLNSKEDVNEAKFVENFSKEPVQFIEGVAEALKSAKAEDAKALEARVKTTKEEILKAFEKVEFVKFGGSARKDALLELVRKLFDISIEDLKALSREELTKKLFEGQTALQNALSLTEKAKEKVAEVKPKPEEKPVTPPVVGEVSDQELKDMAQQQCNRFNQIVKDGQDQFKNLYNALNEGLDRLKNMSKLAQAKAEPKKDMAEDMIPQLMKELMDKKKPEQVAQAQGPQAAKEEKEEAPAKNDSVLDKPMPQPQQQQQQQGMPYMPSSQQASAANIPQFSPDLPTNTGASSAIRAGQDASSIAEEALSAGVPSLTNQFTGRPLDPITAAGVIGAAKTQTDGAVAVVTQQLKNSKNRLSQLTQVMERLKNDAANAVPASLTQLESDKQQALAKAKSALDQKMKDIQPMTQMSMMSGDQNQMMQAQMQQKMLTMNEQAAVSQAQADLDAVTAQKNLVMSKAKPEMATYESQKAALEDVVSDLQAQKSKLDAQSKQLAAMVQANAQQALGSNQQAPNIYNRLGAPAGNGLATGRTAPGGLGGALNPIRGSLGGSRI